MLKVQIGNLFDSDAQTLVNTVNCVGVMGKGIALEFKKRFPEMFQDYAPRCSAARSAWASLTCTEPSCRPGCSISPPKITGVRWQGWTTLCAGWSIC